MRRIRDRNTTPEMVVRRLTHRLGYRFRLHRVDLPGKPDLVFPVRRKVIFVHGCFWHQHPGCRRSHTPRSNTDYWKPKLARNIARDKQRQSQLEALGWRVLVVWECQTIDEDCLALWLRNFLDDSPVS